MIFPLVKNITLSDSSERVCHFPFALQAMLDAANWAPTHGKTEPWRFVVMGKQASSEMLELSAKVRPKPHRPAGSHLLVQPQPYSKSLRRGGGREYVDNAVRH